MISIITVSLNVGSRIKNTADSIVNQTSDNFEWIVIDGGSTDCTLDILRHYKTKMTYFVSEKDKGIYNAMNKGIARSKREYCIFVNGGDEFFDNKAVERFCAFHEKADYNYGSIMEVNGSRKIVKYSERIVDLKKHLFKRSLPHQSSYIRRRLFEKCGGYDEGLSILSDQDFCKKAILKHGASVQHLPWINSIFYFDGLSYKTKNSVQALKEKSIIQKRYFGLLYRVIQAKNEAFSRFRI